MEEKFKNYTIIGVTFLMICSATWQLSYWSTFNINIFAYLDINDIILSSLYPLITSFSLFFILNLKDYVGFSRYRIFGGEMPEDLPRQKRIKDFIIIQSVLLITMLIYYFLDVRWFYYGLPILGFITISGNLFANINFRKRLEKLNLSVVSINTIIIIFLFTISNAKSKSYNVVKNSNRVSIYLENDTLKNLLLIGETNKFIFTMNQDSSYSVFERIKVKYLRIK